MDSANSNRRENNSRRPSIIRDRAPAVLLVFVSFVVFSAVRSPVPAPNEPHYLAKAKHYCDPAWCAGDFFLESADAHLVFFQTVGWLTRGLSLAQTAWIARMAALLLLAVGWCEMASRIVPGRWASLWGAWLFLLTAAIGNLSGEWIVGGVEAKVFTYGLLFWGLALWWDGRPIPAAMCGGLAIAFHPVVGIWGLVCAGFAAVWPIRRDRQGADGTSNRKRFFGERNTITRCVVPGAILVGCALPGLIPALKLVVGVPEGLAFQADYIHVFFRLRHHLDPMEFPLSGYVCYGLLLVVWLTARRWIASNRHERFLARVVVAAALIAGVGLLIGLGPRPPAKMPWYAARMTMLKFYPFRLFDVLLPISASLTAFELVTRRIRSSDQPGRDRRLGWGVFGAAIVVALLLPAPNRHPSHMPPRQQADWLAACRFIRDNTPPDALVLTPPNESWAFKWYAQRAEYVSYKDCPQDAAGIVEWNRRLNFIRDWAQRHYQDELYSADELRELHKQTGVTHVLAGHLGPFAVEPVYENRTYRVYRLSAAMTSR